ncbi:MAG: thioredoxin [Firmicutes bacterium]|nr:thioredoxin [Bacillota bacterium]
MAGETIVAVGEANFDTEVRQSPVPVLVDFWAPWCVPCRMVSPALEEVARERQGQIKVAKVNVDENPNLAAEYGVMSIPTIIRFEGGREVQRVVGALPRAHLLKRLGLAQ